MPSNISSKATIAKNTTLLYARTALIMVVSLYTSRVILQTLGVEDYGVYSAIGGVVSLLSMVIGPIDNAISRFLTFELGRGDTTMTKRYFSTGLTIMLFFSLLAIFILETAGFWFLNNKMVIDGSRLEAANWVLHLSIAAFVVNIISSPYRAAIIAHEKMSLFAIMGMLDAFLKLGIAFMIQISPIDKLVFYASLLFGVSILIRFIYTIICNRNFEECKNVRICFDRELFGGLFTFAGWNMFGAAASVCRGQGINILFNLFGGPIVNAAYGIANQVNSAVQSFVNNFTTALNPSIIKSYASSQKEYMLSLVYQGAKYSFYLILLFALPLLFETEFITHLWLGRIPDYAVAFIQLILIHSLIESLSKTIMAGVHASGNIRTYQVVIGGFQILTLPIAYILLNIGYTPVSALVATLAIDVVALLVRLMMARTIFGMSMNIFIKKVILVIIITTIASIPIPLIPRLMMVEGFLRFFVVVLICVASTSMSILFVGCTRSERSSVFTKLRKLFYRLIHK